MRSQPMGRMPNRLAHTATSCVQILAHISRKCTVVSVRRIVVEVHVDAVVSFLFKTTKRKVFEKFQRNVRE